MTAATPGFGEDPAPGVGKYCECNTGAPLGAGLPEQIVVSKDLRYGSNTNRKPTFGKDGEAQINEVPQTLLLDLYRPSGWVEFAEPAKSNPTRPAVVIVHGGSFEYGRKNDTHLDQMSPTDEARYFAQHGFAAVSIDYRLSATSFLPELAAIRDAIEDTKAAVRWLVEHSGQYGIDPDRIAVMGASAGAMTAGSIGWVAEEGASSTNTHLSSKVAAGVGVSGCLWPFFLDSTDEPTAVTAATAVPFFEVHGDLDSRVYPFLAAFTSRYLDHLGVAPEKNRLASASPEQRSLFFCIPASESDQFCVPLAVVPGGGHVPWSDAVRRVLRPSILAFLAEVMPAKAGAVCE